MTENLDEHRSFLNRYYGISRYFYDLTRKYYLFGRDRAIRELLNEPWDSLVEVGPGTGRNLAQLSKGRPHAKFGGVEASDAMLDHARSKAPFAKLVQGFAETTNFSGVLGAPPDRIFYSYCLSMVAGAEDAVLASRKALSQNGELVIVDFSESNTLPSLVRRGLFEWLRTFHVSPLPERLLAGASSVTYGPFHYYVIARFGRLET